MAHQPMQQPPRAGDDTPQNPADMTTSPLVRLGALWVGTDKNGRLKLTGSMGDARILVLANMHREEGSRQPSYYLYVAKALPRPKQDAQPDQSPPEADDESASDDTVYPF